MIFYWSRSHSKSPQLSKTVLNFLADLNNVLVWMFSSFMSKYSGPCTKHLLREPIIIGVPVTFMTHCFFLFSSKVLVLLVFFAYFKFCRVVNRNGKVNYFAVSLFCCGLFLGQVVWPTLGNPFVSQNPWKVSASHFQERILDCTYIFCSYDQIWLLAQFPVDNLPHPLLLLFTLLEFFTSVLVDSFSLQFEWQHVSSSLLNSSQDSGRSQQCCRLDSLYPSANFQVIQAF